jgi:hypothetical protein
MQAFELYITGDGDMTNTRFVAGPNFAECLTSFASDTWCQTSPHSVASWAFDHIG